MSKSRTPLILGLGAAGGIGYYLYSAGGSPKAAENKFESTIRCPCHLRFAMLDPSAMRIVQVDDVTNTDVPQQAMFTAPRPR